MMIHTFINQIKSQIRGLEIVCYLNISIKARNGHHVASQHLHPEIYMWLKARKQTLIDKEKSKLYIVKLCINIPSPKESPLYLQNTVL